MAAASYTPDEAVEIARHYRVVARGLAELETPFAAGLERARAAVLAEVKDEVFAKVLAVAELMRGINKDERQPVSSSGFLLSEQLRAALRIAYDVGLAVAPFTLRPKRTLLSRFLGERGPRLRQSAKEAMLRIAVAHASSRNRARTLSLAPPARQLPDGAPRLIGRR